MVRENHDFQEPQFTQTNIINWVRKLLPAPSSALFTLFVVGIVLFAQSAGAWPLGDTTATNSLPSMIRYQGRLTDLDGVPQDGEFDMVFRLYKQQDQPVDQYDWVEEHTAAQNAQVTVDSGLFNVWLGSLNPIDPNLLTSGDLYLGVQVAGDEEMSPRERLTGVPFALLANAVADGAVTTAKLAGDAVTSAKIKNNTITEDDIADNFKARDADKLDGKNSSDFAASGHNHDGRYFTESESDSRYARSSHNHDGRYYTEGQSNSRFVNAGGDTMSGNLNMGGNQINDATRLSSPGDSGLVIDAGLGSDRVLTLHDDVVLPTGDLDMDGNRIKNVSRLDLTGDTRIDGKTFVTGSLGDGFLRIPKKDFDPSNPVNGMIYYNNPANCLRIYAKGSWRNIQCW